jgi:hypothetical protein
VMTTEVCVNVEKVLGSPGLWEDNWEMLLDITKSSSSKTPQTS